MKLTHLSILLPALSLSLCGRAEFEWTNRFHADFTSFAEGEALTDQSSKGAVGGTWSVDDGVTVKAATVGDRKALKVSGPDASGVTFRPNVPVESGKSVRVAFSMCAEAFEPDDRVSAEGCAAGVMTVADDQDRPTLAGWTSSGWVALHAEGLALEDGQWVDGYVELRTLDGKRFVSYSVKVGEAFVRLSSPDGTCWLPTIAATGGKELTEVGYCGFGNLSQVAGDVRTAADRIYRWCGGSSGGWDDPANWTDEDGNPVATVPGRTGDVVRIEGSVALTNGSERVTAKDLLLDFTEGVPRRFEGSMRGEVALDVSRPRLGKALTPEASTFLGFVPEYAYRWSRGDPFKVYGDTPVSCEAAYSPTVDDLGSWLRLVVADSDGALLAREFFFSRLPVVYITTDDGDGINVKTVYEGADLRIQGNADFKEQYNGRTEIKGRGNTSWGYPKKPYKLKLDKKTNLFGYGKNKHWVLLSNWLDECFQRNVLAGDLAEELGVCRMDMTWVDVVFNGTFQGNYLLGEHLRVDPNRVDVFDWSDTIESDGHVETDLSWLDTEPGVDFSGGYIFELSHEYDNVSKFTTEGGQRVMIDTPEYANTSQKMMDTVRTFWENYENAYQSPNGYGADGVHYSEMADIDSMVGYWLVQETIGNNDAIYKSRFASLDRGKKLKFGPVWDFDWGCGSVAVGTGAEGWKLSKGGDRSDSDRTLHPNFYREWLDDPLFCLKACELYWSKVHPYMANVVLGEKGLLANRHAYLAESAAADNKRWANETYFSGKNWTRRWFEKDTTLFATYLTKRLAWLDKQFATVDTLMASVKTDGSASPYEKAATGAAFGVAKGTAAEQPVTASDWSVANAHDVTVDLATDLATAATAEFYLNGRALGEKPLVSGACTFTISCEQLDAAKGTRNLLSVIVRDAEGAMLARNYAALMEDGTPESESVADMLVKDLGFAADSEVVANVTNETEYVKFRDFTAAAGLATASANQKTHAYSSYRLSPILSEPYLFATKPQLKIADFAAEASEAGALSLTVELKDGEATVPMAIQALRQTVRKSENLQDWLELKADDVTSVAGEKNRVILTVTPNFTENGGFMRLQVR